MEGSISAQGLSDPAISPEAALLFDELSAYLRQEDISQLRSAYLFSQTAHSGQFRKSGEPYISHPLAVAGILGTLHLDIQTLTAALLHDVMEDTHVSKAEIGERFGSQVAELVDGVSKLDRIETQTQADAQAGNFRKMLMAMARDVRVIIIKLADRLHNMRTLEVMRPEKRRRIARETMEIYVPIATRLGLNDIYQELQERSFRYLFPTRYRVLNKATRAARGNRREVVAKILESIKLRLHQDGLEATVSGREKQLYSIYKKMADKHLAFSEVLDIYGFRVVVKDVPSCYLALGILHGAYKPVPGKFKDYIAIPKSNGYQSLHSTLLGPYGIPIEVQIRTVGMHRIAETGVASHWFYKTSETDPDDLHTRTHQWLQNLIENLSDSTDSLEFLEYLKVDLFPGEVYVFTPQGKILALPTESTAVDFAYAVHANIGDRCVAVKINGENAPLRTRLRNGDRVEIVTAPHAKPNPAWLTYVVTGKARLRIRYFLKTMQQEELADLGERLLNLALQSLEADPQQVPAAQWNKVMRDNDVKSKKDLFSAIALGKRLPVVVARHLVSGKNTAEKKAGVNGAITIMGTEGMAVQFARCCYPVPGDAIVGYIKKDQGLVIHTHDCRAMKNGQNDPAQFLDVTWGKRLARSFDVMIRIVVVNQRGMLAKVSASIAEAHSNIDGVTMESDGACNTICFTLQVNDRLHLAKVMRSLRRTPEVSRIIRVKG